MRRALDGLLVLSLEQAVAAPYCSSRLADAGARVIKIERPEGDFARGYDTAANGLSSYFVWLNRGKQSLVADIKRPDDAALLHRILGRGMIERSHEDALCREFHFLDEHGGISTQRRGGGMRGTRRKL